MAAVKRQDHQLGCGLMGGLFSRRIFPSKKASHPALPAATKPSPETEKPVKKPGLEVEKPVKKPSRSGAVSAPVAGESQARRLSDGQRVSTSSSGSSGPGKDSAELPRVKKDGGGITSSDLSLIVEEHQKSNGSKKATLVRGTSGNVMVLSHLGNLRKSNGSNPNPSPRLAAEVKLDTPRRSSVDGTMGNIVRKSAGHEASPRNRVDPEVLKGMGNERYKKGRYDEALDLYKQAISLDSTKASYHTNMAAALIGLGRLVEAVGKCLDALSVEPGYPRAHDRLATLYLRLGITGKAMHHAKYSDPDAESQYASQAQRIQTRLDKCLKARKLQDWTTVLNKTQFAMLAGADAAPQIYALQAEALLKLHKHQEAHDTFESTMSADFKSCAEIFGHEICAYLYITEAQIQMAMGRLEEAMAAAENATQLDPNSQEISLVLRRVRLVSVARSKGNQLFNGSKFSEALCAYGEGLDLDPFNSLLLCNRATCRSKLGQYEKAIEDCNEALMVRPCYSKARLRRAGCNAKLGRWEAAIRDYETLIREAPGDEEVGRALFDAQVQVMALCGADTSEMRFGSNLVCVTSNERFRHYVTLPGMAVVLFCDKKCSKQVLMILEQVRSRFPSVYFLKVEIEDHPYLGKSEEVGAEKIPMFRIYKNGSRVREVAADHQCGVVLENAVRLHGGKR
uniref:Thioredoxin domain-containing protein n=1 Tax=Kalanchoe fedtschenkoi TaxID=63787 RepID=A0A7N1A1T4_KALFE